MSLPPLDDPLQVLLIDDEIVFLGNGSANFSMTRRGAALTMDRLAETLAHPTDPPGVRPLDRERRRP